MPDLRQMSNRRGLIGFFRTLWFYTKGIAEITLVLATLGATVIGMLVMSEVSKLPDMSYLKNYKPIDSVSIFDKNDKLIETIDQGIPRTVIPFSQVPLVMRQAVLAAEDKRFYEHEGISFLGIMRAFVANARAMKMVEGGSTITQQLAKNLFFSDVKRTGIVKLSEMVAAYKLEEKYTKEEIFSLYLTEIYFGNGARGIEQASRVYFGKSVSDITLPEAAFLAGIIRAPSFLGSDKHRKEAMARQRQVLSSMAEAGFITVGDSILAEAKPLVFKRIAPPRKAKPFTKYPYFTAYVLELIHRQFDEQMIELNGLKIYTTLDPMAQDAAEAVLSSEIKRAPVGIEEEALVSLSVKDGSIMALVGGAHDYWQNQWNCAVNPHTAGSSLKPFVYLSAFMGGFTPETTVQDIPFTLKEANGEEWNPKNFDGKYLGTISVRDALSQSRNMCTIRVAERVGIPTVIDTLRKAGIKTDLTPTLSLALGSSAVTPLDLAAAYGTLARGGIAINPWTIRRLEDARGRIIGSFNPSPVRVFPLEQVAWITDILQDVVWKGTATQAKLKNRPVAGKTGTADKAKDIWFVGFTPDMVTAVWGGGDEKKVVAKNVTGGTVMARIFRVYNEDYYRANPLPAGMLISSPYNDIGRMTAGTTAAKPVSHSNDVPYVDTSAYQVYQQSQQQQTRQYPRGTSSPVTDPSGGRAIKNQKGVTNYQWSH
ncbi:MAG: PBP1A family penicillin-binding protein [Cyanobacteria bacterium SZAS TMP-1]|nr:PBP1A family penicillin-binding protein [Cyanobacteria bacterium SZAS TMP-1]